MPRKYWIVMVASLVAIVVLVVWNISLYNQRRELKRLAEFQNAQLKITRYSLSDYISASVPFLERVGFKRAQIGCWDEQGLSWVVRFQALNNRWDTKGRKGEDKVFVDVPLENIQLRREKFIERDRLDVYFSPSITFHPLVLDLVFALGKPTHSIIVYAPEAIFWMDEDIAEKWEKSFNEERNGKQSWAETCDTKSLQWVLRHL